jgi:hypothetical protein
MNKPLSKTQAAALAGRTLFPLTVKRSEDMKPGEGVLKYSTNVKVGPWVVKGPWAGMPFLTLTLEERATCPRTCGHWADCYGNNMRFAPRYQAGDELVNRIRLDLVGIDRKHRRGFVIRLHVLGDFYSVEYVEFWRDSLDRHLALHIFGYTAWLPGTEIGDAILKLIGDFPLRFHIRFSGLFEPGQPMAVSADDGRAQEMVRLKTAFICPEQTGKTENCGTCGLCWTATKAVVFETH